MTALEAWTSIVGGVVAVAIILGWLTRPLRSLAKDLGPLTDRNSDGESVFDEMRAQLQQLAAEFPKNGVPTRSTVDTVRRDVALLVQQQPMLLAGLAEVKADVRAHQLFHGSYQVPPPRGDA